MSEIRTRRHADVDEAAGILDEMEADPELYLDGLPAGEAHVTELLDARVGRKHGPRTVVRTAVTRLLLDSGRLQLARGSTEVSTRPRYVAVDHVPTPAEDLVLDVPPAEETPAEETLKTQPPPAPKRRRPMAKAALTPARQPPAGETCRLPALGAKLTTAELLTCLDRSAASSVAVRVRRAANRVDTDGPGHVFAVDDALVEAIEAEGYTIEHAETPAITVADPSGDGQASPEPETPTAPSAEPEPDAEPDETPDLDAGDVHAPSGLADAAKPQLVEVPRAEVLDVVGEAVGIGSLTRAAADVRRAQRHLQRAARAVFVFEVVADALLDEDLPAEVRDVLEHLRDDLAAADDLLGDVDAALR